MAKNPRWHAQLMAWGAEFPQVEDRDGDGIPDLTPNGWNAGTCRIPDDASGAFATSQTCCRFYELHADYDRTLAWFAEAHVLGNADLPERHCLAHAVSGKTPFEIWAGVKSEDDVLREAHAWAHSQGLYGARSWDREVRVSYDATTRAPDGVGRKLIITVPARRLTAEAAANGEGLVAIKLGPNRLQVRRDS